MEETTHPPAENSEDTSTQDSTGIYQLFVTPQKFQPKSKRVNSKRKCTSPEVVNEDKRPRTPSGQVITKSVGELKSVIENKLQNPDYTSAPNHSTMTGTTSKHDNQSTSNVLSGVTDKHDQQSAVNMLIGENFDASVSSGKTTSKDGANYIRSNVLSPIDEIFQQKTTELINSSPVDGTQSSFGNPAVMDIRSIINMMEELRVDFKQNVAKVVTTDPIISEMSKKLHVCEFRERTMLDNMHKMQQVIAELQEKNEILEVNNAKRMVVLSGFETHQKKKYARLQLDAFMQDALQIDITIEDFYYVGSASPRDIVLILMLMTDKHKIMQNKNKLKNVSNPQGKGYFFRDFRTVKQTEVDRRCKMMQDDMGYEDPVDQDDVFVEKGKIMVGDAEFVKQVKSLDPTLLLKKTISEINAILSTPVLKGTQLEVNSNFFYGYTICTNSVQQIQSAYDQIRLNHADARHIVCAWSTAGTKVVNCNDYCDDGDEGACAAILRAMKESKIQSRAVFIVRKCGEKLNEKRLPSYLKCVEETIKANARNNITKIEDGIQNSTRPTSYAGAVKSPNKPLPGRGRGSFRGYRGTRGRGRRGGRGGTRINKDARETQANDVEKTVCTPRIFSDKDERLDVE